MRLEVVQLVAEGLSDKEIAGRLNISQKTVEYHIGRVREEWNLDPSRNVRVQITRRVLLAA